MGTTQIRINPWLEECVNALFPEPLLSSIREEGRKQAEEGWTEDMLEECLQEKALFKMCSDNPFLAIPLHRMELPPKTLEGLYWAGVDHVADLMQITAEELASLGAAEGVDVPAVEAFLAGHSLSLRSCGVRTRKIPVRRVLFEVDDLPDWVIPSPGAEHAFTLLRPCLLPEWFEECFRRYERMDGDREFLGAYRRLGPGFEGAEVPYEMDAFVRAARRLRECYAKMCEDLKLQALPAPVFPETPAEYRVFGSERVFALWKECTRCVMDILVRANPLPEDKVESYLDNSDEGKLELIGGDSIGEAGRQLLLSHIELRCEVYNMILYYDGRMAVRPRRTLGGKRKPLGKDLVRAVTALRMRVPDGELRERFLRAQERNPLLRWEEFIIELAESENE